MPSEFRDVDPHELRLPTSRPTGADTLKLQRQIGLFGAGSRDMPPIWVNEGSDGVLAIVNGVTRATRIAKLAPGRLVPVEIIAKIRRPFVQLPKVGDYIP